jgi:flagellar hook-basal body complex protein FliE
MALDPIRTQQIAQALQQAKTSAAKSGEKADFGKALGDLLRDVNQAQEQAGRSVQDLIAGRVEDLHEVMIAMGKAQVSFQFMAQVRNKLLEAYREVMRMQL